MGAGGGGGGANGFCSELALISGMPHSLGAELNPPPHPKLSLGQGGVLGRRAAEKKHEGNKHSFICTSHLGLRSHASGR